MMTSQLTIGYCEQVTAAGLAGEPAFSEHNSVEKLTSVAENDDDDD